MSWIGEALRSSIGRKFVMGLLGLALTGFLAGHLGGNLLMFIGPAAFNGYAHHLEVFPLLIPIELALAAVFLLHAALGVWLTAENWLARPKGYAVKATKGQANIANRTMIYTGAIVFVFLIVHLLNLKYSPAREGELKLYGAVILLFRQWWYALAYIAVMCLVGMHVWHGFQSAFRSIGVHHPKYTPALEWISRGLGVLFAAGFSSIPLGVLLRLLGGDV